ncbi:MAG: amino acid ABC transporter permease [Paracoccaceae bacterium]
MPDPAFVRSDMLPQQAPPLTERGAVKWLRENLFSSPFNTVLTLLGAAVVLLMVQAALPWLLNSVWNASSLKECREIVWASAGPEATGACWALIRDRWHQFLFGFYPADLYWRPVLALGLLLIALAPVLYFGLRKASVMLVGSVALLTLIALAMLDHNATHLVIFALLLGGLTVMAWVAPKRLLVVTVLYPLLGFWLLWGGSVWAPVGTAIGFVLLAVVYMATKSYLGVVVATGAGTLVAAIWWLALQTSVTTGLEAALPLGMEAITSDQFGGFLLAFVIGVTAIGASLPIGILLALGRQSDMLLIKTLCVGFIEFVRGVPLITVLFTATLLLGYFLPPQTNFDVVLRVIILVTFFSAAYLAEVIRGGLAALPKGQYEAADALGLDYWQAQRLIVMPQALKVSIPGIVSTFIGLFKDTTLVAFVGLMDPLKGVTTIVRADTAWKGIYWEPYIFVGAIFFAVCFGMSRYSMYLEQKLKTDHR